MIQFRTTIPPTVQAQTFFRTSFGDRCAQAHPISAPAVQRTSLGAHFAAEALADDLIVVEVAEAIVADLTVLQLHSKHLAMQWPTGVTHRV